ncbi:Exopolysaccharide synthesis, ExoD [Phycisphaerae bacterium RAS1]|nr:Exopolysaccharide synthesis, ExoD [Phycisphaerae bacterium RAS1]
MRAGPRTEPVHELKTTVRPRVDASVMPETDAQPPAESPSAARHRRRADRRRHREKSHLTVGRIVDATQSAGFGFVLALLAVCSVPLPGVSVPFGLAIAFGALQIIIGLHRPWLPSVIRNHRVSVRTLIWLSFVLPRWTSWMEVAVRPRFEFMSRGALWSLCGVGILIGGVGLSLPLPIPFSNLFFVIPLLLYAIAAMEADGLMIMAAHALTAYQVLFVVRFWEKIVDVFRWLATWLGAA